MYKDRKKYIQQRSAATLLQSAYRALVDRRMVQELIRMVRYNDTMHCTVLYCTHTVPG